jgi:hypothetical protein
VPFSSNFTKSNHEKRPLFLVNTKTLKKFKTKAAKEEKLIYMTKTKY